MAKNSGKKNNKEKKVAKSNIEESKKTNSVESPVKDTTKKVAKTSASKDAKNTDKKKKGGFKDFKAELKKVVWPTKKELFNSTVAVISIVIVTGIIVLILDICFEFISTYGIDKLRTTYSSSRKADNTTDNTVTEEIENTNTVSNTEETTTNEATNDNETTNETSENTEVVSE